MLLALICWASRRFVGLLHHDLASRGSVGVTIVYDCHHHSDKSRFVVAERVTVELIYVCVRMSIDSLGFRY